MNVTVIYGSDLGATRKVATRIANKAGGRALDIKSAKPTDFESCDLLILGSPTYGLGDLQCDWEERMVTLAAADLAGKTVALFGTGDPVNYPDSFVDAMGILYDKVIEKGATVVGFTDTEGYDFSSSHAVRDGRFVGLPLDEDGQSDKTAERVSRWIGAILGGASA